MGNVLVTMAILDTSSESLGCCRVEQRKESFKAWLDLSMMTENGGAYV